MQLSVQHERKLIDQMRGKIASQTKREHDLKFYADQVAAKNARKTIASPGLTSLNSHRIKSVDLHRGGVTTPKEDIVSQNTVVAGTVYMPKKMRAEVKKRKTSKGPKKLKAVTALPGAAGFGFGGQAMPP